MGAKGETSMQEPGKVSAEMTEMMAEGLGERTLSRKERREMMQREEQQSQQEAQEQPVDVDEPTREFHPVSRGKNQDVAEEGEPVSLFDDDEAWISTRKRGRGKADLPPRARRAERQKRKQERRAELEAEDDEEDVEDEEETPAPIRRSKSARRVEEDEIDDEDDYDEDDEDDEPVRGIAAPRRDVHE